MIGTAPTTSRSVWNGGWVGLVGGATEGAVGDIEDQGAEHVDDGFHALDERDSGGDQQDRTEQERTGDADDDHAASQLRRHEEVREQVEQQVARNTLSSESERSIRWTVVHSPAGRRSARSPPRPERVAMS